MKCDPSVWYLDQGEYTDIILKILIRVISLLLWSCQLTGKKKFEHRLKKNATVKGKGVLGLGCSRVRNPNLGYLRVRVFKSWGVWGLGYLKVRVFKGKCVQELWCLGLGCLRIRMFKGKGV